MGVKEALVRQSNWVLERQYLHEYGRMLLVKRLVDLPASYEEGAERDYTLFHENNKWLLQFVGVHTMEQRPVLLYEDFQGIALEKVLEQPVTMPQFYQIAEELVNACIALHQQDVLFQELNPSHIFIHPTSLQVKLMPSAMLSRWGAEANLDADASQLLYLAPEQTGRMQVEIDERADLYALGVIFYQILVGDVFQTTTKDELLFQIVTKRPDLSAVRKKTGLELLELIIAKLLEKNPADRYQSALSLKQDLQLLQEEKLVNLASGEPIFQPKPSTELCGREDELGVLSRVFEQVVMGNKRSVFIEGVSGSGKSSFVYQLKQQVLTKHGYFVECKFEERQQHGVDTLVQPLRQLLKQVYFKGRHTVELFREAVTQSDLVVKELLLKLLPELRVLMPANLIVIGDDVEHTMQQNTYLFTAIHKILKAVVSEGHPVVWLIDDTQWADTNVLDHVKRIYMQHEVGYLLVITTARDEPATTEALVLWQQTLPYFTRIKLRLLHEEEVQAWVEKSIFLPRYSSLYVAKKLFHFTRGNPLFMKEVFLMMLKSHALYFDLEVASWKVNEELLQNMVAQQDIIGFIAERMDVLSPNAQTSLKFAACIGRSFTFDFLRMVVDFSERDLMLHLDELVENGFILVKTHQQMGFHVENQLFQFVHDRIQQTAYEAMAEEERTELHYKIGQLLMKSASEEQVALAVGQFNLCTAMLTEQEKKQLALQNYELGVQAKKSGMFEYALQLFLASKQLLPENHWQSLRDICLPIYTFIGECAFLSGHYEQSQVYMQEALQHAKTSVEKLEIYRIMTFLYFEAETGDVVLEIGYLAFEECRIKLPQKPQKWHVLQEYAKLKWALKNRSNAELVELPPMERQEIELLIQIITNLISSSFRIDSNLSGVLLLRAMRLLLKYGSIAESAVVFINYAIVLAVGFQDTKQAMRFGKLAKELADQQSNPYIKTRVYFSYGSFISYWEKDYGESVRYIRAAQHYAQQCGLNSIVGAASCFISTMQWMQGLPLKSMYESICFEQGQNNKQMIVLAKDFLVEFRHWTESLRTVEAVPNWHYAYTLQHEDAVVVMHHIMRLQMSYFYNDELQAKGNLARLAIPMGQAYPLMTTPLYYLYRSLWQFDWLARKLPKKEAHAYRQEIKVSMKKFKKWTKIAPQNFEHYYTLLQAERCRDKGLEVEAMLYYDRALQLAKIHQFSQDVGLIYERAAKYYASRHDRLKTKDYIVRGIEAMQQWGAYKVGQLWDEHYETYLAIAAPVKDQDVSFDMKTVLETTQSLAKEIRMEDLLQKLLFSLLKHANATAGYFMRQQHGKLELTAMVQAEQIAFSYFPEGQTIQDSIQLVADFVLQCDEPILIPNVTKSSLFTYARSEAKSILCLPVYHKGEVTAVLYLENSLLYNAFSTAQLELIQMVTMQIAVSIENAKIYEDLEVRVAERTKQYEEMNQHLIAVNERLEKNEAERKKLFQSISHELRSPITSSLGYIEAILDEIVTDPIKQREYLLRSKERLFSLKLLIQDLFDLAKLEAGRIDYELSVVNVKELYESFSEHYRGDVLQAGLSYEASGHFTGQEFVLIDLTRIEQVMTNLMTNAIKYTKQGHIKLVFSVQNQLLCCEVNDTGIGILSNDLPFIFDSYFKGANVANADSHGVGLAICKQIIEQHNGRITVESIENQGSRFSFELPLVQ